MQFIRNVFTPQVATAAAAASTRAASGLRPLSASELAWVSGGLLPRIGGAPTDGAESLPRIGNEGDHGAESLPRIG